MLPRSRPSSSHLCLIGLGANLPSSAGLPRHTLEAALRRLPGYGVRVLARSRWYANPAWPPGSGPDFVNGVVLVETALPAPSLLRVLGRVEAGFGRRRIGRGGARPLDLDLLAYGSEVIPDPAGWRRAALRQHRPHRQLVVPHPALHRRPFVLLPLLEVVPGWLHPALGRRGIDLADRLCPAEIRQLQPLF